MRRTSIRVVAGGILIAMLGCSASPPTPPTPQPSITPSALPSPSATPTDKELVGRPLNAGDPPVYRLMPDGGIRHLADWLTFISYGYLPQDVVSVSPERLKTFTLDAPLTRWVTGIEDHGLYLLYYGKRYPIPDDERLLEMGGSPRDVSQIPDDVLAAYPTQADLPAYFLPPDELPRPIVAAWYDKSLWIADAAGGLTRWNDQGQTESAPVPSVSGVVTSLDVDRGSLILKMSGGPILRLSGAGADYIGSLPDWAGSLVVSGGDDGGLWFAGVSAYDQGLNQYHTGGGLGFINEAGYPSEQPYNSQGRPAGNPSAQITALLTDPAHSAVWAGTAGGGLLRFDPEQRRWRRWTTLNSDLPDNAIHDLTLGPDGDLWLAANSGVIRFTKNHFTQVVDGGPIYSLALARDGSPWAAGSNLIARVAPDGTAQTFTPFDHPQFLDQFRSVALDDQDDPWFVGDRQLIHLEGQTWSSIDRATGARIEFSPTAPPEVALDVPTSFPSPASDYLGWLQTWPRPAADNGRCIHYLQLPSGDDFEARQQIARMLRLRMRWVLVNYNGPGQLVELAPIFQQAGIRGVWRPHVRPNEPYTGQWARDVKFLRSLGIPPYIQVYNEPSLDQEWDGQPVDQAAYLENLSPAVREVYQAGGYVGLQQIDPAWLRANLQRLKAEGLEYTFDRLFFVPHPYGFNHPPDYAEDSNGVLGFRDYAQVFREEIGFVPPMIAGEGGWRPGEAQDARFPKIDDALHRDYSLAVFDWFASGRLSDGEPLPDYLFAYCPWLLSDPVDPAAWFDSRSGDRLLTTQAVKAVPNYVRRFSWDRSP